MSSCIAKLVTHSLCCCGQYQYCLLFVQTTFLVGVLYLAVGVLRLGFFANFLSHSVISGFTTGAALIIGLSQMKYFFGISIDSTHTALDTFIEIVKHIDESKWREIVMCSVWLAVLLSMKKASKHYKKLSWLRPLGPITVCVAAIIVVVAGDLDGKGLVKTVSTVPKGVRAQLGVCLAACAALCSVGFQSYHSAFSPQA
jgi:sulfate transporter 4